MVSVESVTKQFGSLTAVNRVSFKLGRDEIVGFVGPNGAGKSTLLKMLSTYLYPNSGKLYVDGLDVVKQPLAVRRKVGYLAGDTPLYQEMRTDRFLAFIGKAHGLTGGRLKERLQWVVDACGLERALPKRVKECSSGYRKRIGLGAALIHDPEVILLDEPTHGLDPLQVLSFRDLLKRLRAGRVIFLSSHIISEVATICDRLLIIHDGHLLADGTVETIRRQEELDGADLEDLFLHLVRKYESAKTSSRDAHDGQKSRT